MDTQLINRMQNLVNSRVDDDINKNIASYILQNIYEIDKLTISDLAANTYTSTASISRFARNIGCESFNDLKQRMSDDSNVVDAFKINLKDIDFDMVRPFKAYVDNVVNALQNMEEKMNVDEIDELVKEIHENENVYFLGHNFPGLLAQNAQRSLILAGKYVHSYDSAIMHMDVAKQCPKDSLIVVFSMNGQYLLQNREIGEVFRERHVRLILVTQDNKPFFANYFHKIVTIGDQFDCNAGRYKLELFMEIMVNRYIDLYYGNK